MRILCLSLSFFLGNKRQVHCNNIHYFTIGKHVKYVKLTKLFIMNSCISLVLVLNKLSLQEGSCRSLDCLCTNNSTQLPGQSFYIKFSAAATTPDTLLILLLLLYWSLPLPLTVYGAWWRWSLLPQLAAIQVCVCVAWFYSTFDKFKEWSCK